MSFVEGATVTIGKVFLATRVIRIITWFANLFSLEHLQASLFFGGIRHFQPSIINCSILVLNLPNLRILFVNTYGVVVGHSKCLVELTGSQRRVAVNASDAI